MPSDLENPVGTTLTAFPLASGPQHRRPQTWVTGDGFLVRQKEDPLDMGVIGGKEVTMSGLSGDFSSAQRKGGGENTPSRAHCQTHGGHPDRVLFNLLHALHIAEMRKLRLR